MKEIPGTNAEHIAAATFRKASGSGDTGCVEVAVEIAAVGIRDSKPRNGEVLRFGACEWDFFLSGVRNSELDQSV
jgi:hypothetical protein